MDKSFWHQNWENNNIGFHNSEPNRLLVKYFSELLLPKNSRVFVPMCGKTLDISWLLSNGYRVAGAELSEIAVRQLFEELELEPTRSNNDKLKHYSTNNIDIFAGDIFHLSEEMLGRADAVYDRAALVALPEEMRTQYTRHLTAITDKAPQLVICYEYDQSLMEGPPFSISREELYKHYGDHYDLASIVSTNVQVKGVEEIKENVWLLKKN